MFKNHFKENFLIFTSGLFLIMENFDFAFKFVFLNKFSVNFLSGIFFLERKSPCTAKWVAVHLISRVVFPAYFASLGTLCMEFLLDPHRLLDAWLNHCSQHLFGVNLKGIWTAAARRAGQKLCFHTSSWTPWSIYFSY